ncbi:MAG: response regulator [Chloroflexaceae bacterium]|nr:response regulator [Chloroflexaceae bacterium]
MSNQNQHYHAEKATIVVVEDDVHIKHIVEMILFELSFPYHLSVIGNAEEALTYCQQHVCHLLMVDYSLPGMNGLELVAALKEAGFGAPIVLLTGYEIANLERQIADLGIALYLRKPFPKDELLAAVQRLLGFGG